MLHIFSRLFAPPSVGAFQSQTIQPELLSSFSPAHYYFAILQEKRKKLSHVSVDGTAIDALEKQALAVTAQAVVDVCRDLHSNLMNDDDYFECR